MKKTWQVNNNEYFLRDTSSEIPKLTNGVYNLQFAIPMGLYLKKMSDKFEFDFKLYGLESKFISKVVKTYKNTRGNLGVICNGIKGTGKTITAELLANALELPIILIGSPFGGINDFLTEITQDVIVFVDEYEKVFKGNISEEDYDHDASEAKGDSTLLSLMDGTYKTEYRKVFLLTTNRLWVNENMINRPGRIRYMKNFSDLTRAQVDEIMDDCLKDKKWRNDIVTFMKPLEIITVDIMKAIISEVNIFNEPPVECCKELNLKFKEDSYCIYRVAPTGKKDELIQTGIPSNHALSILHIGSRWQGNYIQHDEGDTYFLRSAPDISTGVIVVNNNHFSTGKAGNYKIKLKKESSIHKVFSAF